MPTYIRRLDNGSKELYTLADGQNASQFAGSAAGAVPTSSGGTTNFLRADGTWAVPPGTGGIPDGDKGDITASSSGSVWTIDNDAVTYAKLQNVSAASKLLGKGDSGAGDAEEITLGTNLSMSGTTLNATGGGSPQLVVPLIITTTAGIAWTNMPSALTFFQASHRSATKVDLTNMTQCRLIVNKQTVAGAASSVLILKYRTTFDTTVGNWLTIGSSEVQCAVNVTDTVVVSSWINLVAGAKADVFVVLAGSGGDGVLDPQFGSILAQFK